MASKLPQLSHILETILYTKSADKSREFYKGILGLQPLFEAPRGTGYAIGTTNLLIFNLGETTEDLVDDPSKPEYLIPKHGPSQHLLDVLLDDSKKPSGATTNSLHQHYCFAVNTRAEVEQWERHLQGSGVSILGKKNWERGGLSVYFSDPDGHVAEIASRGIWPNY